MAGDDDGGDPSGSSVVSNASVSPPATATAKETARPSSTGAYSTNESGHAAGNNNGGESSPSKVKKAGTAGNFFPNKAHVTDALRAILAGLDASDPVLVYRKHMPPSDRCKGQNRLLMSCKCESRRAAFASVFTEAEMPLVHRPPPVDHQDAKHDVGDARQGNISRQRSAAAVHGLAVQAYDCGGRAYELSLKYLSCNTAYRIVGPDYTVFLNNNGLLVGGGGGGVAPKRSRQRKKRRRSSLLLLADEEQPAARDAAAGDGDVQMELWAFRSPKLSVGEKDQPDGALGLLLLHRRGGEAGAGQVRVGGAAATTTEVAEPRPREVVVVEDDAAAGNNKLGDAVTRSTRDMPLLSPVERLIASFLSYDDHHSHTADVNDDGDKQGPS